MICREVLELLGTTVFWPALFLSPLRGSLPFGALNQDDFSDKAPRLLLRFETSVQISANPLLEQFFLSDIRECFAVGLRIT